MASTARLVVAFAVAHHALMAVAGPVNGAFVAAWAFNGFMLLGLYFGACDRPPPATVRRGAWAAA